MRWFELAPHVGVNPDGSPQPLVEENRGIMTEERDERTGHWVPRSFVVKIRPYVQAPHGQTVAAPLTRVVCIEHPAVAAVLAADPKWVEIDPPKAARPRRPHESQSPRRRR